MKFTASLQRVSRVSGALIQPARQISSSILGVSEKGDVPPDAPALLTKLSGLDHFLPIWILLAMAARLILEKFIPAIQGSVGSIKIGGATPPIALGLLLMIYPILAKVRYEKKGEATGD